MEEEKALETLDENQGEKSRCGPVDVIKMVRQLLDVYSRGKMKGKGAACRAKALPPALPGSRRRTLGRNGAPHANSLTQRKCSRSFIPEFTPDFSYSLYHSKNSL